MAHNTDKLQFAAPWDIAAALGILSRLPVRIDTDRATARGAASAWAYPFAGMILGALACAIGQIALWLGLPNGLAAGLSLAALVIITGAMHEDGLADTADGLWGGWDKNHRLKIMKDSHTGVYGVLALTLGLGLRWQALTLIIDHGALWPGVLAIAMLSRAAMVPVMAGLPHARDEGLSQSVGRPDTTTSLIAIAIATFACMILLHSSGLWLLASALLATLTCAAIAKAKIEGQTGDILGATQQINEISMLLTLAALFS
ncbi:adenosylcobinamide-GDP ribazoletransferase [Octadecabacter antarcticus]|nr:adenosylcobinamide-GDP ribazoletransferase [Octadecabacter antarcticus]